MTPSQAAHTELDALLADPRVRARWPGGLTTDEVLAALYDIGELQLALRERAEDGAARVTAEYAVVIALRDTSAGRVTGRGRTLTAAALRCLLEAEADLADEVRRGLAALGDLLAAQ